MQFAMVFSHVSTNEEAREVLRGVIAVACAPIVWGIVMFPGNLLLLSLFPGSDTNPDTGYLLAALVGSIVYSLIAGVATAAIAGARAVLYGIWGGAMLLIVGGVVQQQYWDALPVWYHVSFLAALVPACACGAWWWGRRRESGSVHGRNYEAGERRH